MTVVRQVELVAEAAVTDEIDRLADATWNGTTDSRLVGAWQYLRVFRDSKGRGTRTQEATDLESDYGVETRVLEDYSGRYPIELLQNAQDAAPEKHLRNATVWMHVSDTALLVGNEGRPFDEDRLKGLLNLAVGTKRAADPDHHTIGYKGIGFTSVFEITDAPRVFSANYEFCLDFSRAKVLAEAALGHRLPGVPVCEYERVAGRFPRVMEDGNKGYDIESYATVARSAEVERYIEVKSKQGPWDGFNVRLSRAQLEFGKGPNGSRTCLYVVENTGSEQPAVHAIPRVSMLADGFYFDEGWKALSDDPTVTRESVLDGVLSLFLDEVQPLLAELLRLGAEVPMTIEDPIRDLPHFATEWVVEAGWPSASVALVTDTDAARDDYLRGSGWSVVHVGEAAVDVLAQLLGLEDHGDGSE